MKGNMSEITTIASEAAPPLPLDTGSWFVLAITLCVFFAPLFVLFPPFPPRRSDALWQTHTKLGVAKPSASKGRNHGALKTSTTDGNTAQPTIESLLIYPVESCRGIEVTRAKVVSTGLEFDRLYTLAQLKSPFPVSVEEALAQGPEGREGEGKKEEEANTVLVTSSAANDHKWECITQRQFPRLATVQVELWQPDLDKLKGLNDKNAQANSEAFLILRFPWREPGFAGLWDLFAAKCLRGWAAVVEKEILLPVAFPPPRDIATKGYGRETVRVGRSETNEEEGDDDNTNNDDNEIEKERADVVALDMSVELPEELGLYLGVSNKLGLFRAESEALPEVSAQFAPGLEKSAYRPVVGFHDSYPVRIMNLSSVPDRESKATKDEESTKRFRANVLISGPSADDEDQWKKIKIRPDAASQDSEIMLRSASKKGRLGVHMTPLFDKVDSQEGFLEVGMSVDVLER